MADFKCLADGDRLITGGDFAMVPVGEGDQSKRPFTFEMAL